MSLYGRLVYLQSHIKLSQQVSLSLTKVILFPGQSVLSWGVGQVMDFTSITPELQYLSAQSSLQVSPHDQLWFRITSMHTHTDSKTT